MNTHPAPPMRFHEVAQHALGLLIGLAVATVAIDYGRFHAPRATAPILPVQSIQD